MHVLFLLILDVKIIQMTSISEWSNFHRCCHCTCVSTNAIYCMRDSFHPSYFKKLCNSKHPLHLFKVASEMDLSDYLPWKTLEVVVKSI